MYLYSTIEPVGAGDLYELTTEQGGLVEFTTCFPLFAFVRSSRAGFVIPGTARGSVSNSSVSAVRVTAWDNVAGELACPNLKLAISSWWRKNAELTPLVSELRYHST